MSSNDSTRPEDDGRTVATDARARRAVVATGGRMPRAARRGGDGASTPGRVPRPRCGIVASEATCLGGRRAPHDGRDRDRQAPRRRRPGRRREVGRSGPAATPVGGPPRPFGEPAPPGRGPAAVAPGSRDSRQLGGGARRVDGRRLPAQRGADGVPRRPAGVGRIDRDGAGHDRDGHRGARRHERPGSGDRRRPRAPPAPPGALQLKRLDPWSVLKMALALAVVLFLVWLVAVGRALRRPRRHGRLGPPQRHLRRPGHRPGARTAAR